MNICSYKKTQIIDSLINDRFNCILFHLDSTTSIYSKDSISLSNYTEMINSLKASQKAWNEMRQANAKNYMNYYKGGSISSMITNLSVINDSIDRLKKLDDMFVLLLQDTNIKGCK